MSGWEHLHAKVDGFASLPYGWDTYKSPPITAGAIAVAHRILDICETLDVAEPYIVPEGGGGVGFEWVVDGRVMELNAEPDGSLVYVTITDGELSDDIRPGDANDDTIRSIVSWLK